MHGRGYTWQGGMHGQGVTCVVGGCVAGEMATRVFHSLYKVGRNGNFKFKGFNNSKKMLPPVGLDLVQEIIAGLGVQCLTI